MNSVSGIVEYSECSSLDVERKNQQDKRAEKREKVASLHRASAPSILQAFAVWRRQRLRAHIAEKKLIAKYEKMPATALAVARNPELFSRGRGKLH